MENLNEQETEIRKEETAGQAAEDNVAEIKIEDGNLSADAETKEDKNVEAESEEADVDDKEACESETGEDDSEEGDRKPKERKLNWAKRGEKKETEEDKLKAQIAEANDKYARLFAEFDNFRKRSEKEKIARYDMGAKDIIEKILPIVDNFERGFDTVEEADKEDAFVTGMDLVYKQLVKALEDMGVKPIEAVGREFDPELHNAVMHVDDPEAGENIVVEEFQKGYLYKDHVVRYSMVKVAN